MPGKEATMIELSPEQGQALDNATESPPRVLDPRNPRTYVLVAADQYERIKDFLDPGPLTEDERRVILQGVWRRARWDDPLMDEYEALDPGNSHEFSARRCRARGPAL
jgi:hypothetical protein